MTAREPGARFRLVLSANRAWNLFNFRSGLLRHLVREGHEVYTVAPPDHTSASLRELGCRTIDLGMSPKGANPIEDLQLLRRYLQIYRSVSPDLAFHYTIKPNVYGTLAAALCRIPSISVVTGLGFAFLDGGPRARIARLLYRLSFRYPRQVWFLNGADEREFLDRGLVRAAQTRVLPGEGVDTEHFAPPGGPARGDAVRFLMMGRLLADKGVREYVDAARTVRARHPHARFQLLGDAGAANPSAIGEHEVRAWAEEGTIEYLGSTRDVRPYVAAADCVVLPSYREGVSRVLLEAAAMARPIIATDAPGCRDIVEDGATGLLCRVRDAGDLAAKMHRMLTLTPDERAAMGLAGRNKVVNEFDERIVIDRYVRTIPEFARPR